MTKKEETTYERLSREGNHRQRKEFFRRLQSEDPGLAIVHPNAAGIDIGNESHYVAIAPDRASESVREFGSWTEALQQMADWLKQHGIEDVVMQSTGVYWIAVYEILERAGFRVCLTNARDSKNLPGRKTDVQECQWLRKLHTYGLLRNSFRPPEEIRRVRTIWRLRDRLVKNAAQAIQHMQKALTTMNVQVANAISDIGGVTGQKIIRAILAGERDPSKLAEMRDYRIRASKEEIARSLQGNWQEDVLFELRQAVDDYDFRQRQIGECDAQLGAYLQQVPDYPRASVEQGAGDGQQDRKKRRKSPRDNEPKFDLHSELKRICGVDLTTIDGVDVMTVQTFVSELGTDMSRWRTEDHLVSYLKLARHERVSVAAK